MNARKRVADDDDARLIEGTPFCPRTDTTMRDLTHRSRPRKSPPGETSTQMQATVGIHRLSRSPRRHATLQEHHDSVVRSYLTRKIMCVVHRNEREARSGARPSRLAGERQRRPKNPWEPVMILDCRHPTTLCETSLWQVFPGRNYSSDCRPDAGSLIRPTRVISGESITRRLHFQAMEIAQIVDAGWEPR
jgi:hypothetical protein